MNISQQEAPGTAATSSHTVYQKTDNATVAARLHPENETVAAISPFLGEMPMLDGDAYIPVSDVPAQRGYAVIELRSLDDLRAHFCDGAFVYVSKIRGFWLFVPVAGE